ncbi:MAG TPA: hypothetical protein VLI90_11880 [Tepidisphaeraceae bacterium]|nr:hypothetical protein [Tepidisphaeraceae bacterium]
MAIRSSTTRYVPSDEPVIAQVRAALPRGRQASLLVVSAGGNDGLASSYILGQRACHPSSPR